jgi:DNA-directed RNA polymerase I subunit RPA49
MESDTDSFIFNSKILIYIASMLAFREVFQNALEKNKVHERLVAVPSIIVDGLLSRFAEMARGSSRYFQRCPDFMRSCIIFARYQPTSATRTSLLTHIFALCLKVDDYATDTQLIAHDLSMQVPE